MSGETEHSPSISRGVLVVEARAWIGTSYRHQASLKGAGCDCLGLLRGVWRAVYGEEPEPMQPYSPDWDEVARDEVLLTAANRNLVERSGEEIQAGNIIMFRMRQHAVAKHLGIASGEAHFIHAYSGHGVVESALTYPWRRRIAGVFDFPGLD